MAIQISKAEATCTVNGYTGVYDAAAHGARGSCAGVDDEEAGTLDLGDSFTNVPGGTAHWVFTGNGNYNDQSGDVAITISKASSTTTVTCPVGVTYTGSAKPPCSASVNGAGGLNQSLTVNYTNNTNVGTATASATYAGDANHTGSCDSKTFSILYSTGLCLGSPGHPILQPINADCTSVFKKGSTVRYRKAEETCAANRAQVSSCGEPAAA